MRNVSKDIRVVSASQPNHELTVICLRVGHDASDRQFMTGCEW